MLFDPQDPTRRYSGQDMARLNALFAHRLAHVQSEAGALRALFDASGPIGRLLSLVRGLAAGTPAEKLETAASDLVSAAHDPAIEVALGQRAGTQVTAVLEAARDFETWWRQAHAGEEPRCPHLQRLFAANAAVRGGPLADHTLAGNRRPEPAQEMLQT